MVYYMIKTFRIPEWLAKKLREYAMLTGKTESEAIREFIEFGLLHKTLYDLIENFENQLANKSIILLTLYPKFKEDLRNEKPFDFLMARDGGCINCHRTDKNILDVWYLDDNPYNLCPTNIVLLCKFCQSSLQQFILSKHLKKRLFYEWLFFSNNKKRKTKLKFDV